MGKHELDKSKVDAEVIGKARVDLYLKAFHQKRKNIECGSREVCPEFTPIQYFQ